MITGTQAEHIEQIAKLSPQEGLKWLSDRYGNKAVFSSGLGMEDQVITHMIAKDNLKIAIFTLDTGRLFQETYDLLDITRKKYNLNIQVRFPEQKAVEQLVNQKGPNSFYESVENRKECCHLRKVLPLEQALHGSSAWITGIRANQSLNRTQMNLVEWDEKYQLIKYNPLLHWSLPQVEQYIDEHRIPVNDLHKKGYPSIGCAPCTRAIMPGEDIRAGRWWWENSSKECGLHQTR